MEQSNEPNYDSPYGVKYDRQEHIHLNGNGYKAVMAYGWNGTTAVPLTAGDATGDYSVSDVDDASSVKYYGYLNKDGGWYIMKEDTSASPKTYRYIKGGSSYDFSSRAGLTYTTFDLAF